MDSIEEKLDGMSTDEVYDLAVELYRESMRMIAAGEGTPELEATCAYARKVIDDATQQMKKGYEQ